MIVADLITYPNRTVANWKLEVESLHKNQPDMATYALMIDRQVAALVAAVGMTPDASVLLTSHLNDMLLANAVTHYSWGHSYGWVECVKIHRTFLQGVRERVAGIIGAYRWMGMLGAIGFVAALLMLFKGP